MTTQGRIDRIALFCRQRSLEEALADLRAKFECEQGPQLARMIRQLETEIALRGRRPA